MAIEAHDDRAAATLAAAYLEDRLLRALCLKSVTVEIKDFPMSIFQLFAILPMMPLTILER